MTLDSPHISQGAHGALITQEMFAAMCNMTPDEMAAEIERSGGVVNGAIKATPAMRRGGKEVQARLGTRDRDELVALLTDEIAARHQAEG